MLKNVARRNNTSGNVGTEFCDYAVFEISGDAILVGINFLNAFLDGVDIGREFDVGNFLK